nr:fatty-acid-binding protein 1 [Tanacetum cinerariifolium]
MVSFHFPFSIPPLPTGIIISPARIACSVALTAGISAGISISQNSTSVQNTLNSFVYKKPCFGSLSLSEGGVDLAVKEEKNGVVFPGVVEGNKGLLGVGLRRKVLFGLKNIDVYAFEGHAKDIENCVTVTHIQTKKRQTFWWYLKAICSTLAGLKSPIHYRAGKECICFTGIRIRGLC